MAIADLIKAVEVGRLPPDDTIADTFDVHFPHAYSTLTPMFRGAFGGSTDSAVALLNAVLPGWFWLMGQNIHDNTCYARVTPPGNLPDFGAKHDDNPARALLLAILKALAAKEPTDD